MTETPAGSIGPPAAGPESGAAHPSRLDSAAARWLAREAETLTHRTMDRALARALRTAAETGALGPLRELPERSRRELLELIERRIVRRRATGKVPRLLVHLTTTLAPLPSAEFGSPHQLSVPAR
jgi:hypothetical protein